MPQRLNFDSFGSAFMSAFVVTTGENWDAVMYEGIQSYGGLPGSPAAASIFFLVVVISGQFIMLSVFLAIAIDHLGMFM